MTTCHLILRKCGCSDLPLSFFWELREVLLYSNDLKVRELLFERDGHFVLYCQKHDSNWKRSRFSFLPVFSGHSYKRGAERSSFPSLPLCSHRLLSLNWILPGALLHPRPTSGLEMLIFHPQNHTSPIIHHLRPHPKCLSS